jgi:hypothetical protein
VIHHLVQALLKHTLEADGAAMLHVINGQSLMVVHKVVLAAQTTNANTTV